MPTYNSTSGIDVEMDFRFKLWIIILFGIIIVILVLFAIIGNILTIAAFVRDKKLRTVYNMYIVNLAITDLLIGCLSMTIYSTYDLSSYHWHFGYHFCKVFLVVDFALCLESVLIIFIISLDRLLLLRLGTVYEQKVTTKKAGIGIAVSWCLAFFLYTPAIIGYDHWTGIYAVDEGDCDLPFVSDFVYTTVTAVMEFLLPFIGISVSNLFIYIEIRKRTKLSRISPMNNQCNGNTVRQSGYNTDRNVSRRTHNLYTRKDVRAAKFLSCLVILFFLTWAPYTICTVVISFCEDLVSVHTYEILTWLLWSKASLNPFLYAFNSSRFRKNFKEMRGILFYKNNSNDNDVNVYNCTVVSLS